MTETLQARVAEHWQYLTSAWDDLYPSERETYSDSLVYAERAVWNNRRDLAETRLDQLAEWIDLWLSPRFEGFSPEPCDPFGIGAPCRWEPPHVDALIDVPPGLMPEPPETEPEPEPEDGPVRERFAERFAARAAADAATLTLNL